MDNGLDILGAIFLLGIVFWLASLLAALDG